MGILSRFGDIISANINALLDKCEDPAKMVDEYLLRAKNDLADVKKETASVMALETSAKRELDKNKDEIKKYEKLAMKALEAENEDDAAAFILQKQRLETLTPGLQKTYDAAHANADKMRQLHDKLTNDIKTLEARRNNVKAQVAVTKTQEKINAANDSAEKVTGALGAFNRMEEKAQREFDEAMATEELNNAADDTLSDIEAKYSGANSMSVAEELAKMKEKLNK